MNTRIITDMGPEDNFVDGDELQALLQDDYQTVIARAARRSRLKTDRLVNAVEGASPQLPGREGAR